MDNTHYMRSNSSRRTPASVTPGHLFTHIPAALGFYPSESVVLMGFSQTGTQLTLGPVARLDIDSLTSQLAEAFAAVAASTDVVYAFAISQRPGLILEWVTDYLFDFSSHDDRGIDACWHTCEIAQGQPYSLCFGPDKGHYELPPGWSQGSIPALVESPLMREAITAGHLPELSREEVIAPFEARNPHMSSARASSVARICRAVAEDIINAAMGERASQWSIAMASNLICDINAVMEELEPAPAVEELCGDEETLQAAAVWLSMSMLRDVAADILVKHPHQAGPLLLALARTFEGDIRSNALCIYSVILIEAGEAPKAGLALNCAYRENPHHSLSALLVRAYRGGLQDKIPVNVHRGSEQARRRWDELVEPLLDVAA